MCKVKNVSKFITLIFSILLLISLCSLGVQATGTITMTKGDVEKSGQINDNLTYQKFKASISNNGINTNQVISYVRKSAGKANVKAIVWSKSLNGCSNQTVINIAKDFESQNPDYKVLAGINADYFYGNNSINAQMSNGELVQASNHTKYTSIGISDDSKSLYQSKTLTMEKNYSLMLTDNNGKVLKEVIISNFNTAPTNNSRTSVYFGTNNGYTFSGVRYFDFNINVKSNRAASTQVLKGKVTGENTSTPTDINKSCIVTMDKDLISILETNPYVKVSKYFATGNNGSINVVGVGSKPLDNGTILEYSKIGDQDLSFTKARHPRSSIGLTSNGDLIICAIDGRSTISSGVDLREEAYIMKSLGCVDCYNFDGGGSTQLIIRNEDESFSYLNQPSETRAVTNAVLLVESSVGYDYELTNNGLDYELLFTPIFNKNVEIVKTKVYLNNNELSIVNGKYNFTINERLINYLSIEAVYKIGNLTYSKTFFNKRIVSSTFTGYAYYDDPQTAYKITYDLDGGKCSDLIKEFYEGDVVTLPTPVKSGYKFIGWYEDGMAVTVIGNKNYNLIAVYEQLEKPKETYYISYSLEGGECNNLISFFLEDEDIVLPIPHKDGYKFLGWFENEEEVTTITNKNYVLTAKWESTNNCSNSLKALFTSFSLLGVLIIFKRRYK